MNNLYQHIKIEHLYSCNQLRVLPVEIEGQILEVQGVQDQNFQIQVAIAQKPCMSNPRLAKPKCV